MAIVYEKTKVLTDTPLHYCPGCTHGIIHRLVAEAIDELGIQGKTIGIAPVGCAVFAYNYFNCDMMEAAHGRAPADGDLASIGAAEITHAATRGANITVIFVNNAIYGMTGGQMAPTTLPGQVTTTSPYGRDPALCGYPIRVSEMLSTLDGPAFIARASVHDVKHIMEAKKYIKKAFETQLAGKGFSMVEVLSSCPTNWGMTPREALNWLEANMIPQYPLGIKKEVD